MVLLIEEEEELAGLPIVVRMKGKGSRKMMMAHQAATLNKRRKG